MERGTSLIHTLLLLAATITMGCGSSFEFQKTGEVITETTRYTEESGDSSPDAVEYIKLSEDDFPWFFGKSEDKANPTPPENGTSEPDSLTSQEPRSPRPSPPLKLEPGATDFQKSPFKPLIGKGTVYYMPILSRTRQCNKNEIAPMMDPNQKVLAYLCQDEIKNCAMQGSCFYIDQSGVKLFAVAKVIEVVNTKTKVKSYLHRFKINTLSGKCPQGMGVRNICLDPYRSIAADHSYHPVGSVVYVPILKGQLLPNGETHDGYLIVRDSGGRIKGKGRFDFFIGFDDYRGHLFSKLNLADERSSKFEYYMIPDVLAHQVRAARDFPLVPPSVHSYAQKLLGQPSSLQANYESQKQLTQFFLAKWKP